MNHMEKVATMLGVEMGEKFKIRFDNGDISDTYYTVNENGFGEFYNNVSNSQLLQRLLLGNLEIVKNPWKPSQSEKYYWIAPDGRVWDTEWCDDIHDKTFYKVGNCFRTKEEITQEIIAKYVAFYNSDEKMEI